jgi:hypothetical protein
MTPAACWVHLAGGHFAGSACTAKTGLAVCSADYPFLEDVQRSEKTKGAGTAA